MIDGPGRPLPHPSGIMLFADRELARGLDGNDEVPHIDCAHARPDVVPGLNPAVRGVAGGFAACTGGNSPCCRAVGLGLWSPAAEAVFARVKVFYRSREATL